MDLRRVHDKIFSATYKENGINSENEQLTEYFHKPINKGEVHSYFKTIFGVLI